VPIAVDLVWDYTADRDQYGTSQRMQNAGQGRQALEDLWRQRTTAALREYREAKAATAVVKMEHSHGLTPTPDGGLAWTQALKTEIAAMREYCRVLDIFNGLVIYGKAPPPEAK
jgi:uncharacterized protein (UPF0548 family)